ncbi:MAG: pyrimidine 5'-nucleotidase [Anaerolineaceae bacterium]|nr:pyrimidine 5'-nucleotidase [Anaerolineaceae bacterium]MBN2676849.1 pyrimidine 5'-nucleotidase [Anaerolineaceae bacterium]
MPITTLILDLDETVYPSSTGLWDLIGERIFAFIHQRLELPAEAIHALQYQYFNSYGTTLRGLELNNGIDARDYLDYVHDVPIENILAPDQELHDVLSGYPQRKVIFTNSDKNHTQRVLERIGIADLFDGVVDVQDIRPHCKPQPEAFQVALNLFGGLDAADCLFIDDSLRNIQTAAEMGMSVVHINEKKQPSLLYPTVRYLKELPQVFSKDGEIQISSALADL